MTEQSNLVPMERIESAILMIRGHKVLLDADLAAMYEVDTKVLNQAVKRNSSDFLLTSCSNSLPKKQPL